MELKTHCHVSLSLCLASALGACQGIIEEPSDVYALSGGAFESKAQVPEEENEPEEAAEVTAEDSHEAQPAAESSTSSNPEASKLKQAAATSRQKSAVIPEQANLQPAAAAASAAPALSVGTGDLASPAQGPAPFEARNLSGEGYKLVKNWDFGAAGTIRSRAELEAEFEFHDQFNTIANGTNYGAVTVASCNETAIGASGLGLPSDRQPLEDASKPIHEWTDEGMLAHVRPLSESQQTVSVARHDAGNGSLMAKWRLPNGGALLGKDLVWETRVRMPKPLPGFWFALWTAGDRWNRGAEMDVVESFGTPNINFDAFHSDSVGGQNMVEYKSWPNALDQVGVPDSDRQLSDWHIWTWVYNRDDSFEVYYDGHRVQHGTLHWTHGASESGEPIDMRFLFDFSWGHTQVSDVNIELPASMFPLTYEIDYSRVYLR